MAAKKPLLKSWSEAIPAPVVIISGPENFLAGEAFSQIKKAMVEADAELAVYELNADSYEAGQLLTFASPSLFGEPRLIRVSAVEKANDIFLREAIAYLEAPDFETTLILRHEKGTRGKALLEAARKTDFVQEISCVAVSARDRPLVVKQYANYLGGGIEQPAMSALLEAFQGSLDELLGAVRQLLQSSNSKRVTLEMVSSLTGGRVEATAFKVADAAIAGNARSALVMLRQALATGTAPVPLLAAINLKVRTMVKVFGVHESAAFTAKRFGLQIWQVEKARKDVYGWEEQNLARILEMGAATEEKIKGGSRDPLYALEKYVLAISLRAKEA